MGAVLDVLSRLPFDKDAYEARRRNAHEACQTIHPDALRREADLMMSAHPDYRFLMPHEKTELFRDEFARIYRRSYRTYVDINDHEKMTGLLRRTTVVGGGKLSRAKMQREYSSLWFRRQMADTLEITYGEFISYAIDSHMDVKRKKLPAVNQLISGKGAEIVIDRILKRWKDHSPLVLSDLPQYRNEFYCGLPAQRAQRNRILSSTHSSSSCVWLLSNGLLSDEEFLGKYRQEILENFKHQVERDPKAYYKPYKALDRANLFPGCFQSALAYNDANGVCGICPFAKACAKYDESYLLARKLKGGINDYEKNVREQNRIRKQRQREKARAEKLESVE